MSDAREDRRISRVVRPRALEHLRQFKADVGRRFPGRVDRIVLFGSRARGDARAGSDFDVAVFMKDLSDRRPVDHALSDLAYRHVLAGIHIRAVAVPDDYLETQQRGILSLRIAQDGLLVDAEG